MNFKIMGPICSPGENLPKLVSFPSLFFLSRSQGEKNVVPAWYMLAPPSWNASILPTLQKFFIPKTAVALDLGP